MEGWEDRRDQCWPLLLPYLPSRDLICLSLSSSSILSRFSSTPGWWQQVCQTCLGFASTRAADSDMLDNAASAADEQARRMLLSMTALAHHVKHARSPPPQTVQIPPWLPGQPGKCRGFNRIDPSSLNPPLLLDPRQLSWLSYGSLSGFASGVFISSCSSSHRSHLPCSYMAAVVCNKTLIAELYIPRNNSPPDPWHGVLSARTVVQEELLHSTSSSKASHAVTTPNCTTCSSSSSSTSAQAPVAPELWISSAVLLERPQPPAAAAAAAGGRRGRGRRGRRGGSSAGSSEGSSCIYWTDVYKLIMYCIDDNSRRCRAVRGTTVIPPATPTAAAIELQLMRLTAAGGPVMDLRRLQWDLAAAQGQQHAAAAAAAAALEQQQHQQQQQQQQVEHEGVGEAQRNLQHALQGQSTSPQQHGVLPQLPQHHHHQVRRHQQQQQQQQFGSRQTSALLGEQGRAQVAAAAGGTAGPLPWQAAASAAAQSALSAVYAARAAAAAAAGEDDAGAAEGPEGDLPEVLAALVEQLPGVVPDLQLLVLPVLLPGGRAAHRIPATGGSRLSAPKLLFLNVPFLMALRKHVWERMPQLRHVLLMVGPPLPLPAAPLKHPQQQHQQWRQQQHGWHNAEEGACSAGGNSGASSDGQGCQESAGIALQQGANGAGVTVQGTFTLQQLEQQWQQQLQLGQCSDPGVQQQQEQQRVWDPDQQDEWFEQQVAQQRRGGGLRQEGLRSFSSSVGREGAGQGAAGADAAAALSRAAVDALHDMVHSCMDRSS